MLTVLVPNVKGYELAVAAGARSVCMVLYGSDAMAQANVRMDREQAENAAIEIIQRARLAGIRITAAVAVAFECPYQGKTDPGLIGHMAHRFLGLRCG